MDTTKNEKNPEESTESTAETSIVLEIPQLYMSPSAVSGTVITVTCFNQWPVTIKYKFILDSH